MTDRPRITVFGIGDYYRKLRPHLWKLFDVRALVDTDPQTAESLGHQEKSVFVCSDAEDLPRNYVSEDTDICLVLTPNRYHASYLIDLLECRKAVVVEKPFATTLEECELVRSRLRSDSKVYFSDYYLDVRAVPLLWFADRLDVCGYRQNWIRSISSIVPGGLQLLGEVRQVSARIIESDALGNRRWLLSEAEGGVLLDLMVHLLAILRSLFPSDELTLLKVTTDGRSIDTSSSHETCASGAHSVESHVRIDGVLEETKTTVTLEVAKGASRRQREFVLHGTRGSFRQTFEAAHHLEIETEDKQCRFELAADHYYLTALAITEWFTRDLGVYGWMWTYWSLRRALQLRDRLRPAQS